MSQDTKVTTGVYPATQVAPTVRVALPDPRRTGERAAKPHVDAASGRYREHGVLGRGGMGEVRLVEDGFIGRDVAVKSIVSALAGSNSGRARFLREVRIQGQLEHPSIVPVYDLGVDAAGNDFFTMKRVVGRTLASVLRGLATCDPQSVAEFPRNGLLAVFRQVCLAVAYAHSRGVVHRDLKPANVMIGDFGEVYVLDWGIARLVAEHAEAEEELLGTPGYMAPEQLDDASEADARADVYALGAILFELLALQPWHPISSAAEAIASTKTETLARPATRAPDRDIAPELDDLCARATALRREDRVQTARELADAVERYLEGDRDVERRRQQARRHAEAARLARSRVAAGGPDAVAARREALREAGRAVALDPSGREGLRAAIELMLEPPPQVPAEVKDAIERAQSDRVRAGIVPGLITFGLFMAVAVLVPLAAGPINWSVPLVVVAALAAAFVATASLRGTVNLARRSGTTLFVAMCATIAIAFTAGYGGPMLLIPPLGVALANALTTSQLQWRAVVGVCLLGVTLPFIAEWAGLIQQSYEFRSEGMLVRPVVMQLTEVPVRVASLLTTVGVLIGSSFYVRRVILVETELRRSWLMHNWHLQQMAQIDVPVER